MKYNIILCCFTAQYNIPYVLILTYSLFDKHPEVRETYFQPMVSNSSDLKITLEKHGSKVVNALGVIVLALQTEDDAKLLGKVKEVLFITEMLLIFTHRYEYNDGCRLLLAVIQYP